MEKAKMVSWLIERIGSKAHELQNGYMDDNALEMIGDDIHSYLGMLKDLVLECVTLW